MSEPLSSHEIEDVLSSIRRLVSEELRPALRQAGSPEEAPGAPPPLSAQPGGARPVAARSQPARPEPGKLVLTAALRVVPPVAPTLSEGPDAEQDAEGQAAVQDLLPPDAPLAEPAPDAADFTGAGAETEDLIWASAGAAEASEADLLIEEDAELPAAATPPEALPRGHWTAETVPQVDWIQPDDDWIDDEPVPFAAHPRAGSAAPEGPPEDPLARAWADRAEAEVRAELLGADLRGVVPPPAADPADAAPPSQAAAGAAPGPGLFDGDDPGLDEEMLRDIVRDIIREELAGTLGERITRNVRKLVRVEINRAMTARDFE